MNFIRTLLILAAISLTGCASTHAPNPADPYEQFNRSMYTFNDTVDKVIAKPVAQSYNKVMPEVGKHMISNFFSNLDDVIVTLNDVAQLKLAQAVSDGSRVLFNSTFGVFGLFDFASRLDKHDEDFGQTLGYWGMKTGPYLMLPLLGPSSFRDGIGRIGDSQISPVSRTRHVRTRNQMYLTRAISGRAQLLSQEQILDGALIDRYAFIRDAYLQQRQSLVFDGNPPHDPYEDEDLNFEYQPQTPEPETSVVPPVETPMPDAHSYQTEPLSSNVADVDPIADTSASKETPAEEKFAANSPLAVYKVWLPPAN